MTDHAETPHDASPLPSSTRVEGEIPPLLRDKSFWGMSVTQFLGAFNDNVFKQLLLLIATPTAAMVAAAKAAGEPLPEDYQGTAMTVFAVAILMMSGFAGWLADRFSKRTIIISSKAAEVLIMGLGMIGFYFFDLIGLTGMFVVLFLMGVQTAFFGPPKYGILPETIHDRDLPQANGIFLMFTFVAIIFGTVLAGLVKELSNDRDLFDANGAVIGVEEGMPIWIISGVCVLIAAVGTATSFLVRKVRAANPDAGLGWSDFLVPPESIALVKRDRELLFALMVTSSFWLLGSIVQQAVNALGKTQLGLGDGPTSLLAAMLGVGIPIGCLIGGKLSAGRINPRVVTGGAIGIVVSLALLSLQGGPEANNNHLLGFYGSIPVLVAAGISTGIFIVPIQVAVQALPPADEKGRMIALMNQVNWIGIIVGAQLYNVSLWLCEKYNQPLNMTFAIGALVMLPIALFYRPQERELGD